MNLFRIVVRFDEWDINSHYPDGHFVRGIGPIGDTEVCSKLHTFNLFCSIPLD